MVSMQDYGIDKLPEDQRLDLAKQILGSLTSPPGMMSEEEALAEALRRDAELDAHPEMALSEEEFWAKLEKRR